MRLRQSHEVAPATAVHKAGWEGSCCGNELLQTTLLLQPQTDHDHMLRCL